MQKVEIKWQGWSQYVAWMKERSYKIKDKYLRAAKKEQQNEKK